MKNYLIIHLLFTNSLKVSMKIIFLTLFLEQKMKTSNLKETFWIMKATCIN